jgi:hypothetical protein
MTQNSDPLQRLFRAASLVSIEVKDEVPAALERAVLAGVRRELSVGDELVSLLPLLRRGFLLAFGSVLVAAVVFLPALLEQASNDFEVVNPVAEMSFLP